MLEPSLTSRRLGRVRLEVRQDIPRWHRTALLVGSVVIGILVSSQVLIWAGVDAGDLVNEFVVQNLSDPQALVLILMQAVPLVCVSLSAAVAFRVRFWNLGIEGQMIWGAIGATAVTIFGVGPPELRLPVMFVAAMLGAILWIVLPLFLKQRIGVNEIITTLLLNYVAGDFLLHLLFGPWKDPHDSFPHSAAFTVLERLPSLGGAVNSSVLLVLAAAIAVWWLVRFSRAGFYMSVINANPRMARAVGTPVVAVITGVAALSAALSGLAGFVICAGQEGRLTQSFYQGYGFSGILIAFLARTDPLASVIVSFLIALLFVTGRNLQVFYQIPFAMVQLIQAIIVISVASSEFFIRHRVRWAR